MELASIPPGYVTATGVMELLHIRSKTTLHRYLREGLPSHQIVSGGRRLFDPAEVQEWIQSRCMTPDADQTA